MISADGERLAGWYLPSRNGAAVVLRHGAGSTTADVMQHARVLNDDGYGVLATDARGHGKSDGLGMDLGWYGELDTRAAVDFLAGRRDVEARRIGVVGLSMGGEEAIGAAGIDRRIRAVVAEGATGRTAADKAWLADEYGVFGVVQGVLDAGTYGLVDLLTPADPPPTLEESVQDSRRRRCFSSRPETAPTKSRSPRGSPHSTPRVYRFGSSPVLATWQHFARTPPTGGSM